MTHSGLEANMYDATQRRICRLLYARRGLALFRFDIRAPDHLAPLLGLGGDEFADIDR